MPVAIRTPEPEIEAHAYRPRFLTAYKLRMLAEADGCTEPGAIGALLRREGWYSSHLATWRAQSCTRGSRSSCRRATAAAFRTACATTRGRHSAPRRAGHTRFGRSGRADGRSGPAPTFVP